MNLLTFAAKRFDIPLEHTLYRRNSQEAYQLTEIKFTNRQLIASYGEGNEQFDVIIRGEA